mmetsp:Transcript_4727/g.11509  ORF Transcript_4727/g.11509 Transcript_4727/m.11509 type:complete len:254 (-) Transcript_4727:1452-2213(-)
MLSAEHESRKMEIRDLKTEVGSQQHKAEDCFVEMDKFKQNMENWKAGVADVLAEAEHDFILDKSMNRIDEMNTVLSETIRRFSDTQLTVIQVEKRLEDHLEQYLADSSHQQQMCSSVRSMVESAEAESFRSTEALAQDLANIHHEMREICSRTDSLEESAKQSADAFNTFKKMIDAALQHHAKHATRVDEILGNVAGDTQTLFKGAKVMESRMSAAEANISDTYEALARSCQVLSAVVKIPSPIPAGTPFGSG